MLQKIAILTVILVVLGGTFWYMDSQKAPTTTAAVNGTTILSELDPEKLSGISIQGSEDTVELNKGPDGQWTVQPFGYPADPKKIHKLFLQLVQVKLGDVVTDKAKHHERFQLMAITDNSNQWDEKKTGKLLKLSGSEGDTPLALILGKNRSDKQGYRLGQYIRYADQSTVYLISEKVNADVKGDDWLDTAIINLDGSKLFKTLELQRGEEVFRFARDKAEDPWGVVGAIIPDPIQTNTVTGLSNAMVNLEFAKLQAKADSTAPREKVAHFTAEAFDGRIVKVEIGEEKVDDRYLVSMTMSLRDDVSDDALKQEVDAFNKRSEPWFYALNSWMGERFLKERSDLFSTDQEQQ